MPSDQAKPSETEGGDMENRTATTTTSNSTDSGTQPQSQTASDDDARPDLDPEATSDPGATPPDGGWGWVVVISSFMISVFVDGVCFSVGIFFTPFRDYFDSSKSETAWVGSVLNGTYLSIGPIVGAFVNRFGCRKIALIGSLIATTSFFLSTFSTSISVLIFTYGFLGGVGFGFVYLPAIVMVGYYFEKRRALATGIACCGSGIGAFLFAPLGNFLLGAYGWKGAIWILSGIVLNGVVFAIFYRPLPEPGTALDQGQSVDGEASPEEPLLGRVVHDGDDDEVHGESRGVVQEVDAQGNPIFPPRVVRPDVCIEVAPPAHHHHHDDETFQDQGYSSEHNENGKERLHMTRLAKTNGKGSSHNDQAQGGVESLLGESWMTRTDGSLSDIIRTVTPQIHPMESPRTQTFRSDMRLKDAASPVARLAYSQDAFTHLKVRKGHSARETPHHRHQSQHHLELHSPLRRQDIFYSGSLRNIPEFQSSRSLHDYRRRVMKVEEVEEEDGERGGGGSEEGGEGRDGGQEGVTRRRRKNYFKGVVCDFLLKVFDVSLLSSPTFIIYGISCFLCMLGFFVPFIYLPTLCLDLGMGTNKAAFLISIIGIANTIGRVVVGFVSDQPWADCLLINNVALVVGGAATCCVPFFSLYPVFAAYTFLFGTSIAVFVSLRSIIMVELMGLQKLTNAFGLVIMCQGISTYIGAPIAGMLADVTGDYNISFYVAGVFMALSGAICVPLRRIAFWEAARASKKMDAENC